MAIGIEFLSEGQPSHSNESTANVESEKGQPDNSVQWMEGNQDAGRAMNTDNLKGSTPQRDGEIVFLG